MLCNFKENRFTANNSKTRILPDMGFLMDFHFALLLEKKKKKSKKWKTKNLDSVNSIFDEIFKINTYIKKWFYGLCKEDIKKTRAERIEGKRNFWKGEKLSLPL